MKKRLFVCSNFLTLLFSLYAIEKNEEQGENHLMLLAHFCKPRYFNDMTDFANKFNVFSSVSILDNYLNKQTQIVDVERYAKDVNVDVFDEVYGTCYYEQAIQFMEYYKNADLYFLSNGLASYFPQKDCPEFYKRFNGFYFIKYFDKMVPYLVTDEGIKGIEVEKEYFKNVFLKLAEGVDLKPSGQKSIVLCMQNMFFNNRDINPKQEFDLYKNVAEIFVKQGYVVYLKDHPRTPGVFNSYMKHPQIISLTDFDTYPVESIIYKLQPEYVVSLFSTSLFNVKDMFGINGITFENPYHMFDLFLRGHIMTKSYFESIGANTNHLVKIDSLENQVLYEVLMFALNRNHFSKERYLHLQEMLKDLPLSTFACLKLKTAFLDMLKYKTYDDYLKWQN